MKAKLTLLALLGSILLFGVSGCMIPKGVTSSERVVAVRPVAGGEVAEEITEKRSAWHYLLLAGPDGPRSDWEGAANYTYFLKRGGQRPQRLAFLATKERGEGWKEIKPILNTDLWLAFRFRMSDTGPGVPGHSAYSFVVFDSQHLLREKVLNVRGETGGTFAFDALNQHVTYAFEEHSVTYDVLKDLSTAEPQPE